MAKMTKMWMLCFICSTSVFAQTTITGAGASFPNPVYSNWGVDYQKLSGVSLDYTSVGSSKGIQAIKAKTVDFGASDAPMKAAELDKAGLIQFPMIIGGVVPVANLRGIPAGRLRLTPAVLSDIFMGKITNWADPAIKKNNPGLRLPAMKITVVHREDGSGTTWIFTDYLSKVSSAWKKEIGVGKKVEWPIGLGGIKNDGVAKYVQRINGAIGYVEYTYAVRNKMSYCLMQNKNGRMVAPNSKSFQAAAANADWENAPGFYLVLTDQPGEDSWPITGASFILIYKKQSSKEHTQTMLDFFNWCYTDGAKAAEKLHYVPIPASVVELVQKTWTNEITFAE